MTPKSFPLNNTCEWNATECLKCDFNKQAMVIIARSNYNMVSFSLCILCPFIVFVWSQLDGGKVEQKNIKREAFYQ